MINLKISIRANEDTTDTWTKNHIPQLVMKFFIFITTTVCLVRASIIDDTCMSSGRCSVRMFLLFTTQDLIGMKIAIHKIILGKLRLKGKVLPETQWRANTGLNKI